jgi:uncharacterized membrane protein YfcA
MLHPHPDTHPDTHAHHHHHDIFSESHPPLFPLTTSDYMGLFFSILGLLVAAGGGIGGGGILVPIYTLILGFSPKHAIPLSNITVFGGACANCILNLPKRHPNGKVDRPLVDWDLVLVMEPLTILGAIIGAILNKILPDTILAVLLVILLSATANESLSKAKKMYKKETIEINKKNYNQSSSAEMIRQAKSSLDSETPTLIHNNDDPNQDDLIETTEYTSSTTSLLGIDDRTSSDPRNYNAELQAILDEERVTPINKVLSLCFMFVIVLIMNLLKGGGGFSPIGIKCGSFGFWVSNGAILMWIVAFSFGVRQYLVKRYEVKERVNYLYVEGDIKWSSRNTIVYPSICAFAGFFAGLFGVGGGIVKGPLMLAMNVHPAVSSATSATLILYTSFTATTSFVVFGLLVQDYAIVCLIVGFCATYAGQILLSNLMKKNDRNSYIAFSIGGVVLLSAILMGIQAIISVATSDENHHGGGMCGSDK